MPRLIKPHAVAPGAVFGIAAPGFAVDREKLEVGEVALQEAGFETYHRDDIFDREGYLAGTDGRRAAELMDLVADPRIDAIICARGGYGCDRIVPALDAQAVRSAAKPLVGFSDVTALLLWQRRRAGLIGFHGPMLEEQVDPLAWAHLLSMLTGREQLPVAMSGQGICPGRATGRIVGGSLTILATSIGSLWEVETRDAILLIEDVGERPYRIDRMLGQLRAAGKFERLAGVGVGAFEDCLDSKYPDASVDAVIDDYFRPLGVPVVTGLAFGHLDSNYSWPMGARATIDAEKGELQLLERGVHRP
ncbi:MAG: LD-carboxypeptidase [Myxococcota bacterium]